MRESKFFKFFENIWYHYKYVILIGLAAVIMISVATCQALSKKEPDVFVYHISTKGLAVAAKEHFLQNVELVASDYNGGGVIKADFKEDVYIPDGISTVQTGLGATESFNFELALGDCIIYIMDESFFESNKDYMADLSEVTGREIDFAVDGKGIKIKDLPSFSKLSGLSYLKDEYICIKKKKDGMSDSEYANHVSFFKALLDYGS